MEPTEPIAKEIAELEAAVESARAHYEQVRADFAYPAFKATFYDLKDAQMAVEDAEHHLRMARTRHLIADTHALVAVQGRHRRARS